MHKDPVTGDELTTGEWVSWRAQGVLRNWWMLAAITGITLAVMVAGQAWKEPLPTIWNYGASYWAVLLEGTVGIAMFSQTRRDAIHLRATHKLIEQQQVLIARQCEGLEHLEALMEHHGIETPGKQT